MNITEKQVDNFILNNCLNNYVKVEEKDIYKLERHLYAPELNKLHLKDGKILNIPQCITIYEAIFYLNNKNK